MAYLFNDQFAVKLQLTEQELIPHLLQIGEQDLTLRDSIYPQTSKDYFVKIGFNQVTLTPVHRFLARKMGRIEGEFFTENDQLIFKGRITHYKFPLYLMLIVTVLFTALFIQSVLDENIPFDEVVVSGSFVLVNSFMLVRIISQLQKSKAKFIAGLKALSFHTPDSV